MKTAIKVCVFAFLVLVAFRLISPTPQSSEQQISFDKSPPASRQSQPVTTSASDGPHWEYESEDTDAGSRTLLIGCISSNEKLHFDWPYRDNYARLCLKSDGTAFIVIGDGQILSGDDHGARIRLGNGRSKSYGLETPSDYSAKAAFIAPAGPVFAAARRGERIAIDATYYDAGNQTATFSPDAPLRLK